MEEAKYFLFLLAVPFSYVVAAICNCCCGVDRLPEVNFEMDGVDKVYSQVKFKKKLYFLGRKISSRRNPALVFVCVFAFWHINSPLH